MTLSVATGHAEQIRMSKLGEQDGKQGDRHELANQSWRWWIELEAIDRKEKRRARCGYDRGVEWSLFAIFVQAVHHLNQIARNLPQLLVPYYL